MKKFYCQSCGKEVPLNAHKCTHCGKVFDSVLCPKCGFSDSATRFTNGCPKCGYLSVKEPEKRGSNKEIYLSLKIFISLFTLLVVTIVLLLWQF